MTSVALDDVVITDQEIAFCEGLLSGMSAREAWSQAGFDVDRMDKVEDTDPLDPDVPPVMATVLEKETVKLYLTVRRMELRAKVHVGPERIIAQHATIAFRDPADVVRERLTCPEDIARLPEDIRMSIDGWKWDRHGNFVIQFASRQTSLDALSKHFGIYSKERENPQDKQAKLLVSAFWSYVMALHLQEGMSRPDATR
jgi:hypothetical protein